MKVFVKDNRVPILNIEALLTFYNHYHLEIEFIYMLKGEMTIRVGKQIQIIHEDEMFFAFPFVEHEYFVEQEGTLSLIGIFSPLELADYYKFMLLNRPLSPFLTKEQVPIGLRDLLLHFERYFKAHRTNLVVIRHLLAAVVGECIESMSFEERVDSQKYLGIERTLTCCLEHFDDPQFNLNRATELLGYNRSYLSSLISDSLGISFSDYINSMRITKARSLLSTTNMKIIDVSYECGFSSQRNFNRVFLQAIGKTPSEYRESGK